MSSDHTIKRTTCRATRPVPRPHALLGVVALALACALAAALPSPAGATNSFTLDTNPASGAFAAVAVDSAGSGYFGWERNGGSSPNVTMFCKVPRGGACTNAIALPTGPAISDGPTAVDGAFPVLGSGSTVYVVGQRFIQQDVVVWTSTDGGSTFGPPAQFPSGVSAGSNQSDVLAAPSGGFYSSSDNPGLAFTSVPASSGPAPVTDLTGTSTNIGDSTLGLAGGGLTGNPVEAFHMGGSPQTINFRSYSGTGNLDSSSSWNAPSQVTNGMQPSLAGGPSGLFLASEDLDSVGHYSQVNVRKYTGSGFGQPIMTLQTDSAYDNGGRIFQTPGGRVLVAWVGPALADNGVPIRLYDSTTTGGASFTRIGNVAEGAPNDAIYLIRLAAADDGQGFVSFHEIGSGLLRVADLNPIKSPTSIVTTLTTAGQPAAAKLTVGPGTPITDTATVQGPGGATAIAAGAGVRFAVYSDAGCTQQGRILASVGLTGGTATSPPITLPIGTWYLQAHYGGNAANLASTSACGAEVLTVGPPSVNVAGIIFVGGKLVITAGFNTVGKVVVTGQVTNAIIFVGGKTASASTASNRCKTGKVLLKVGNKKKCVSNSFGTTSKKIPVAGAYVIKLSPSTAARTALKNGKTLHVKVTLKFKPAGTGKLVARTVKITVKGKKKRAK
jgi:hypothetical protein